MFAFFVFSRLGRTALAKIDSKTCFLALFNRFLIVNPLLPQNLSSRSPLLVSFHQAYSYEYAPPLWICPPLVNRLSKTRGGHIHKMTTKSAEGRNFWEVSLVLLRKLLLKHCFYKEKSYSEGSNPQNFRLRRAVRHTNKLT